MMLFKEFFPNSPDDKCLTLRITGPGQSLPVGDYTFGEMYCDEVGCDCRRVLFSVIRPGYSSDPLAHINFGWESEEYYRAKFRGNRQHARDVVRGSLDPINPQSDLAPQLLRALQDFLKANPGFREELAARYRLVKAPSEPQWTLEQDPVPVGAKPVRPSRTWTIPEILEQLREVPEATDFTPYGEALAAASSPQHRKSIVPELIAEVHRVADDSTPYSTSQVASLHQFAIYLLAEFREPLAWPAIRRVFSLPENQLMDLLDTLITEDGPAVLASLAAGDPSHLMGLMQDESISWYVRNAALEALLLQAVWGERPRAEVIEDLRLLFQTLARPGSTLIWTSLIGAVRLFNAPELLPEAREAMAANPAAAANLESAFLATAFAPCEGGQGATDAELALRSFREEYTPIIAADVTQEWCCFNAHLDDTEDWESPRFTGGAPAMFPANSRTTAPYVPPKPYIAPPKVGRNEPCPCGSGKKYKKCCGGN